MAVVSMKLEITDLPALGSGRRVGSRGLLNQLGDPAVHDLGEHGSRAVSAAVRRDLRLLEPGAVGVLVEGVAGLD
jgi:hypothetical protein